MLLSAATLFLLSGARRVAADEASEPSDGAPNLAPRSSLEGVHARRLRRDINPKPGWRNDLPWSDLKEALDDPSTLKDVGPANFIEECAGYIGYEDPFFPLAGLGTRTNWDLIDTPSGVCTPDLFSGFANGDPTNRSNKRFIDRYDDTRQFDSTYDQGTGIVGIKACEISVTGPQDGLCDLFNESSDVFSKNCEKNFVLKAKVSGDGEATGKFSDVNGEVTAASLGLAEGQEVAGMVSGNFECSSILPDPTDGSTVTLLAGSLSRCKICWKGTTNFIDTLEYPGCAYDCAQFDQFIVGVKQLEVGTIQHSSWAGWINELDGEVVGGPVCDALPFLTAETEIFNQTLLFADATNQNGAKFACEAATYSSLPSKYKTLIEDEANPSYDIASKVLFPRKASDAVAAVKFAGNYGLQVSVKNSGHSYSRSSSKGDTLLLNMRQYETDMIDVIPCDKEEYEQGDPCKLARARGKTGLVHTSSSRNWAEVYGAVQRYNSDKLDDGDKFFVTGGAAATVSPNGWGGQGGLSGTTGGRLSGFGAHQVLQFEMVLANGEHVRFGPTDWENISGCADCAPKTTEVKGKCNANADGGGDEDWVECDEETQSLFPGLWMAMRGGGNGYGVILSQHIQLHPYQPYVELYLNFVLNPVVASCVPPGNPDNIQDPDWPVALLEQIQDKFLFTAFLGPTSLGLEEGTFDACGSPGFAPFIACMGTEPAERLVEAWKIYLNTTEVQDLLKGEGGLTDEEIVLLQPCNTVDLVNDFPFLIEEDIIQLAYEDYATAAIDAKRSAGIDRDGERLPSDDPPPSFAADQYGPLPNVVVPKVWIRNNLDEAVKLFPRQYAAFGGFGQGKADDQMSAVTEAYKNGGNMYFFKSTARPPSVLATPSIEATFEKVDLFWREYFPRMFNLDDEALAARDKFPSVFGSNHYGFESLGPRKDDWTKACPLEWSRTERESNCISVQEAVWGTELLKELEDIRDAVDPNGMFMCNKCVGDKAKTGGGNGPKGIRG